MTKIQQILWRIRFLTLESLGMHPAVIAYTILPSRRKIKDWRENFLAKRNFLKLDKIKHIIKVTGFTFSYAKHLPIADIISILLSGDNFIDKNFINNSAFRMEGPYEHGEVNLNEGDVVIDVGANIGLFSIFAAKKVGISGRVFSFEPIAETRKFLNKNITQNDASNVEVFPLALGDENKEVIFSVDNEVLGDSTKISKHANGYSEKVQQFTLDKFVEEKDIQNVDFIKADIEGAERDLLKGAENVIKKFKPRIAICTYHLPDDSEVIEKMLKSYVPEYKIVKTKMKLFASVS